MGKRSALVKEIFGELYLKTEADKKNPSVISELVKNLELVVFPIYELFDFCSNVF